MELMAGLYGLLRPPPEYSVASNVANPFHPLRVIADLAASYSPFCAIQTWAVPIITMSIMAIVTVTTPSYSRVNDTNTHFIIKFGVVMEMDAGKIGQADGFRGGSTSC